MTTSWLEAVPELLDAARATLREAVAPAVAPERRYEAAMVANAIGIAAREARGGASAREAERAELATLYAATPGGAGGGPDDAASLDGLRRSLCRDLRAGAFAGPDGEARLRGLLLAATRRRLAISNPEHLARHDRG